MYLPGGLWGLDPHSYINISLKLTYEHVKNTQKNRPTPTVLFLQIHHCEEGHPITKNSLRYLLVDNWLMAIFLLIVELNLVKCRQRFGCLPWGKRHTLA